MLNVTKTFSRIIEKKTHTEKLKKKKQSKSKSFCYKEMIIDRDPELVICKRNCDHDFI